jgi:NAD(P)-dependent dehydrogenase (short-subunit alcohol dehydrogenase family)
MEVFACRHDTEAQMEIFNSVAIVNGADFPLGNAVALELDRQGARVAGLTIDPSQELSAVSTQLPLALNITEHGSTEAAFDHINATLGPPRILINCHHYLERFPIAGIDSSNIVSPCALARCESVIARNLIANFDLCRLFAARVVELAPFEDGERGVLINTTSDAADDGCVGEAALAAAMGGVVAMTLPLARELGRYGVRALSVIASDFEGTASDGDQKMFAIERAFPQRRGKPQEFANLIASLISSSMMNGTTIRIDGAGRMKPIGGVRCE